MIRKDDHADETHPTRTFLKLTAIFKKDDAKLYFYEDRPHKGAQSFRDPPFITRIARLSCTLQQKFLYSGTIVLWILKP